MENVNISAKANGGFRITKVGLVDCPKCGKKTVPMFKGKQVRTACCGAYLRRMLGK